MTSKLGLPYKGNICMDDEINIPNGALEIKPGQTVYRRKKARRSCHGCQRAHRTCGDERPCQTCVKRGMGHACFDGVRKIPKYLGDTPGVSIMEISAANTSPSGQSTDSDGSSPKCIAPGEYSIIDFRNSYPSSDNMTSSGGWRNSNEFPEYRERWSIHETREHFDAQRNTEADMILPRRQSEPAGKDALSPYIDEFAMYDEWSDAGDENVGFTINSGWSSTFFRG